MMFSRESLSVDILVRRRHSFVYCISDVLEDTTFNLLHEYVLGCRSKDNV